MTPIYAGENRAFVKLRSGEFLCVDTNSIDAIDYLLEFEIERHIFPVFRRFLTLKSVVLDIGANFGFYTVTTGTTTKNHGKLYSFEANPHTFDFLRRSVYANKLLNRPDIVLVNALVGQKRGRGTLHFVPDALGGATMTEALHRDEKHRSVEVDMITIDGYLPPDLSVDLVKIDVEGHEPFVIQGMEHTIRRSPNIRILIEFFFDMVNDIYGAQRFIDYIHSLGLHVLKVLPDSRLSLVSEAPRGENYCLLTRTPEEDIRRKHFVISPDCLHFQADFYRDGRNLLLHGDIFAIDCAALAGPNQQILFYGPYINMSPGRYGFRFVGQLMGTLLVRFTKEFGKVIAEASIDSFDDQVIVEIPSTAEYFEIVGMRSPNLRKVRIEQITVETVA